jgi:uncharacterized protein YbjQ (UPF0145 family)
MRGVVISLLAFIAMTGCATTNIPSIGVSNPGVARAERTDGAKEKAKADDDDDDDDGPLPTDAATIARAKTVKVMQNEHLNCATEALGPIDVHKKMESTDQALEALKLRAAALGAEAIVDVNFEHGEGGKEPTHLSGMAVRCRDLLHGRQYEVIGEVKIDGKMAKEEEAFAALKAKARTMHADMILNVKFVHGEGGEGEGTTLTGTAIRFKQ